MSSSNGNLFSDVLWLCDTGDILDNLVTMLTTSLADDSFDTGTDDSEDASTSDVSQSYPLSLLELSSRIVAKHYTCASLEKHTPPLDERLLRRVVHSLSSASLLYFMSVSDVFTIH